MSSRFVFALAIGGIGGLVLGALISGWFGIGGHLVLIGVLLAVVIWQDRDRRRRGERW